MTVPPVIKAFWFDEQGRPSMARGLLSGTIVFAMVFTFVDVVSVVPAKEVIYDFWQPVILTLIAWAGGPRVMAYLAPAIANAFARVRGGFGSSVTTTTTVEDDDPVPERPVVS